MGAHLLPLIRPHPLSQHVTAPIPCTLRSHSGCRTGGPQFVKLADLSPATCEQRDLEPYAALGGWCPMLARKFLPDTAQAVLSLVTDCKTRLRITVLEDCAEGATRRLLRLQAQGPGSDRGSDGGSAGWSDVGSDGGGVRSPWEQEVGP